MFGVAFLVACGLYAWLALFVAKQVWKRTNSRFARYSTLAAFALVFTWDVIPGQVYFSHLCKDERREKVFKTIAVEKEYFLSNGQPHVDKLADRYAGQITRDEEFSPVFHISKSELVIRDKQTGEVLGTAIEFHYRGGWLSRFLFRDSSGTSCAVHPHPGVLTTIWKEVFKMKSEHDRGGQNG